MFSKSLWYNFRWLKLFTAIITISLLLLFSYPAYAQSQPPAKNVMVHLFEWKWTDIEAECAYLGEKGYNAIQVSPPNEHAIKASDGYPWWQRYQPVSYELDKSRSGNLDQFKSMVDTCWKKHGVKIYVDAIINHMAAGDGVGSNGTPYKEASDYTLYEKDGETYKYSNLDFHPQCEINWDNDVPAREIRDCWVAGGGLPDLETEDQKWVRPRIIDFLNSMIDMGVAGFRIDAAKHMNPEDIIYITENLNDLRSDQGWFAAGSRPFIFQEVIFGYGQDSKPSDYDNTVKGSNLNVTEFRYGTVVGEKFRNDNSGTISDFVKYNFPVASGGWGMLDSSFSVVFTDNHDNQRGHGSGYWTSEDDNSIGGIVTHFYDGRIYNLANVFMLAWPYGTPKVMSSYNWPRDVRCGPYGCKDVNDGFGPPSDGNGNTKNVACFKDWVCEHRWTSIAGMVGFNNYVQDAWNIAHTWHDDRNQIAFARVTPTGDSKGFVVINREGYDLNRSFQTGLPEGKYCDVARGDYTLGSKECDGPGIDVDSSGFAMVQLAPMTASAIHIGSLITDTDDIIDPENPPKTVDVSFSCQNGHTQLGTSVYVAGNIKELGNWSVKNASQKLDPTNYPTWTGTLELPANKDIEWKCVKALESSLRITQWQPNTGTQSGNNEVSIGTSNLSQTGRF
ncbi:MAG: carbohydrate-binding module family 20 domain-containing protein [Crocosphaera sp.]